MNPSESSASFTQFAKRVGVDLASSVPGVGIPIMLRFFQEVRPTAKIADGGDSLLYQWGCYDWGQGEHFELNITRQFIARTKVDGEDDDVISQLALTFSYPASNQTRAFRNQDRWCRSTSELAAFRGFIDKSNPFVSLKDSAPLRVQVEWSPV